MSYREAYIVVCDKCGMEHSDIVEDMGGVPFGWGFTPNIRDGFETQFNGPFTICPDCLEELKNELLNKAEISIEGFC